MKKLVAMITLVLWGGVVFADCNLRARTVYQTYQPTVVKKIAVQEEYHQKVEKIILVPKAIKVEVQREHYYSIDSYAQQNLLADAIVGRLLLAGKIIPSSVPGTGSFSPSGPPPNPGQAEVIEPLVAGAHQDPALLAVLNESCVKCHGINSKYTKFVTADGKIADVRAGKVWESFARVNSGNMPKGGKSLDDPKVKLFYAWGEVARK